MLSMLNPEKLLLGILSLLMMILLAILVWGLYLLFHL